MTIVSYLKLSKDSGMGCADERETHMLRGTERTYDVARKIFQIGDLPVFVGSSGSISSSKKIVELTEKRIGKEVGYDHVLSTLEEAYTDIRNSGFEATMLKRYNVTWEDFRTGRVPTSIMEALKDALDNTRGQFSAELLLGGYDSSVEEFRIHDIVYPGHSILSEKFDSIGSGSDMADTTMGSTVDALGPLYREKIEKYLGARMLMEAVQAAWRNFGVGGRTQLVWTERDQFHELGVDESNFLNNLLVCEKKGFVDVQYVSDAFKKIIHDGAKAEELLKETCERMGDNFQGQMMIYSLLR